MEKIALTLVYQSTFIHFFESALIMLDRHSFRKKRPVYPHPLLLIPYGLRRSNNHKLKETQLNLSTWDLPLLIFCDQKIEEF